MSPDVSFTIADLARLTGLNVRTIRYWIAQGLIPASGESGPGAHYGQGHLDRLRLIKRLQADYLPNAEIRRRLAPLSDEEVAQLVAEGEAATPRPVTSALDYVRGLLGGPANQPDEPSLARQVTPAAPAALPTSARRPPDGPPPRLAFAMATRSAALADDSSIEGAGDALAMPRMRDAGPPQQPTESPMPERSQWERLSLGPNVELHIRRPLSRPEQRRVERLITIARQVFDEDQA